MRDKVRGNIVSDAGAWDFRVSGFGVCVVGVGVRGDSLRVEECGGQEGGGRDHYDDEVGGGC